MEKRRNARKRRRRKWRGLEYGEEEVERERKIIEEMAEGENRRGRKRREVKDLEGREGQVRPDDMRKRSI